MPRSDTWRTYGFEGEFEASYLIGGAHIEDATPVKYPSASTGFDGRTFERKALLVVINTLVTAHGVTYTITESATTNGTYTAATTSGTLTIVSASGITFATVKKNPAMPFIRVTATGDSADTDITCSITVLGI